MLIEQKKVDTWLCKIGGESVAIASNRLKMIVEKPKSLNIIGAPKLYNRMLSLQGKFYPIINMRSLLAHQTNMQEVAGLILYKNLATDVVSYGVIEFDEIPQKIFVSDDMAINIDELSGELKALSIAAFEYVNKKVNVLDIDKVFNLSSSISK